MPDDRYSEWADAPRKTRPTQTFITPWRLTLVFIIALGITLWFNGP